MAKPKRILQVFSGMSRHGAESMIMNLYRNIDKTKIQFDFIVHTNQDQAFDDEITSLGGKIFRVPRYTGKNHFKYIESWNDFFVEHPEYKIIHGHVRSTAAIYLSIAKKYGLVTIAHSHSTSNGTGLSSVIKNIYQRPIKSIADYLFAASKKAGVWLFGEDSVTKNNFKILHNSIEVNKFSYNNSIRTHIREKMGIKDKFVIGHVGRFIEAKNHAFIIDVFKRYTKINANSILLLVGDGPLRREIQEKVKRNGISDKVIFLGVQSDVHNLLQAMDIFLFPSFFEGLPVTLIEAQASGLPVLASDTITSEVKITDLVVQESLKKSPKFWAKKIDRLFKKPRKNRTKEIVKAGYNIEENAHNMEQFYINLLNK